MKKRRCRIGDESYAGVCDCEECTKVNSITKFAKNYYESVQGGYLRLCHFEACTQKIRTHFKLYTDPIAKSVAQVEFDNENYRRYLRYV